MWEELIDKSIKFSDRTVIMTCPPSTTTPPCSSLVVLVETGETVVDINFISYLLVSAGAGGGAGQPSVRTRYHLRYRHCQLITTD